MFIVQPFRSERQVGWDSVPTGSGQSPNLLCGLAAFGLSRFVRFVEVNFARFTCLQAEFSSGQGKQSECALEFGRRNRFAAHGDGISARW